MIMKNKMLLPALLGMTSAMASQAAVLNSGDLLTITSGVVASYGSNGTPVGVSSGSWFGVDTNGDGALSETERHVTSSGSAGGLLVGAIQAPGEIDEEGIFFGQYGWLYTVSAPTGGDGILNLDGLRWSWNGIDWNLGGGAWTPSNTAELGAPSTGYANGVAQFQWSGIIGDSYSLWYSSTEPVGSPTGCGGCRFFWHLEGQVGFPPPEVPVPPAAWLFGSGLVGLFGWRVRR